MSHNEETDKFPISPNSSDDGASTLLENPISPAAQYYSKSKNAMTTGFNHPQGAFLHPKRKSNIISERPSSSCLSSPSSSITWHRSSGRYEVPQMSARDSNPISPSALSLAAPLDDHDPGRWHTTESEPDDYLHDSTGPDRGSHRSSRGLINIGTLIIITLAITMLFMGYPLLTHFYFQKENSKGGYGLGGSNGTGQIPDLSHSGFRTSLVDEDSSESVRTKQGLGPNSDETWNLQWSDEFEKDGRSFYPGHDPFWEAIDLNAHGTGDYEWYDPAAVTTQGGSMVITATEQDIHNLRFRSGHVATWNKLCFTGGYLETSVVLPGSPKVSGWWPAVWTMGNLGRANFGATTQGMWPYTYDACDLGALINQTTPDGLGPVAALQSGAETVFNDKFNTKSLSFQPGSKLSSCTCPQEDHPGPKDKDGNWVARSAPELDVFEAQVDSHTGGTLSLSGQFMPANAGYWPNNATGNEIDLYEINGKMVELNSYRGNVLQQSLSAIARTNQHSYELTGDVFSTWGFEYEPGDNGYVTWWIDGKKAWTMRASAVGPDLRAQISQRPIPKEPMYIIANLALSSGFGYVDWDKLTFPGKLKIDYLRLYQAKGKENIGCDPKDYPTKDYIDKHKEAYTNPNLTTWGGSRDTGGYDQYWPKNKLYDGGNGCSALPRNYPGPLRNEVPADTNTVQQDVPADGTQTT